MAAFNTVVLYGKIINEPVFIKTKEGIEFSSRFTLKVDQAFKNKEGGRGADFIPIHINGVKRMEFAHMLKPQQTVIVSGCIRTETFNNKEGNKVFSMFVESESVSWTEAKY